MNPRVLWGAPGPPSTQLTEAEAAPSPSGCVAEADQGPPHLALMLSGPHGHRSPQGLAPLKFPLTPSCPPCFQTHLWKGAMGS